MVKLVEQDIWSQVGIAGALCITTNGTVKNDGRAVMGRGIAAEALDRYPGIDFQLANFLSLYGNRPFILHQENKTRIVSFPTKPIEEHVPSAAEAEWIVCHHLRSKYRYPGMVPGWACKSSLTLIQESLVHLREMADKFAWKNIVAPIPGIGNGELPYSAVLEVLRTMDDRFSFYKFPSSR